MEKDIREGHPALWSLRRRKVFKINDQNIVSFESLRLKIKILISFYFPTVKIKSFLEISGLFSY